MSKHTFHYSGSDLNDTSKSSKHLSQQLKSLKLW